MRLGRTLSWNRCGLAARLILKNGYKRSTELSQEYGMYRQDYCGYVFSMQGQEEQKKQVAQAQD